MLTEAPKSSFSEDQRLPHSEAYFFQNQAYLNKSDCDVFSPPHRPQNGLAKSLVIYFENENCSSSFVDNLSFSQSSSFSGISHQSNCASDSQVVPCSTEKNEAVFHALILGNEDKRSTNQSFIVTIKMNVNDRVLIKRSYYEFKEFRKNIKRKYLSKKIPPVKPKFSLFMKLLEPFRKANNASVDESPLISCLNFFLSFLSKDFEISNDPEVHLFLGIGTNCFSKNYEIAPLQSAVPNDIIKSASSEIDLDVAKVPDSDISINDFEVLKVIGKGNWGKVYLAKCLNDSKYYAIKSIKRSLIQHDMHVRHTMNERKVLSSLPYHPFIVQLRYSFRDRDSLNFVFDFVPGGELFWHLQNARRFSEKLAKFYAAELLITLSFLHDHNILYRDLKPENILIAEDGHIVLADFGLSKPNIGINGSSSSTFCGTMEYLAPELIEQHYIQNLSVLKYGRSIDWWSFGAVLHEMLVGIPPFYSENKQETLVGILQKELVLPEFLSEEAKDILRKLLDKNPKARLGTLFGSAEIKAHPFFAGISWKAAIQKKLNPPFVPIKDPKMEMLNFDPEFVDEAVDKNILRRASSNIASCNPVDESQNKDLFQGFSWISPSLLK